MKKILTFVVVGFVGTLSAADAQADTLKLKDGNSINGSYAGGDATGVRFNIGGQLMSFTRDKIVSLTFTAAAAPVRAAPAAGGSKAVSGANVPKGTVAHIKLTKGISSQRGAEGMPFEGRLESGLQVGGKVVLPAGAKVYGKTVNVKKGGRLARRAELGLVLTAVMVGNVRVDIKTGSAQFIGEKQGTVGKVAVGAALGAAFGGKKGARRGAAVGGTMAVLSRGKGVNIPPGTMLDFALAAPLTLP